MSDREQRYRQLLEIPSLDGLLSFLLDELKSNNQFEYFDLSLLDPSGNHFISHHIHLPDEYQGILHTYKRFKYQMLDADAYTESYVQKTPLKIDPGTIGQYSCLTQTRFERWKMEYQWVFPILSGNNEHQHCIGILSIFTQRYESYDINTDEILQTLGDFAPQIERLYEYADIEEKREQVKLAQTEQQRFLEFITNLNDVTTKEAMFPLIAEAFSKNFDFEFVSILLKEQDTLSIQHTLNLEPCDAFKNQWHGYAQRTHYNLSENDGASSLVMMSGKHMLVPDIQQILHLPMSSKDQEGLSLMGKPRTFLLAPIEVRGTPVGVLWLISLKEPMNLDDQQIALIRMLCSYVGSALRNAETYSLVDAQKQEIQVLNKQLQRKVEQLDELASKDRLTNLFNFGSFQEELHRKINEYQRDGGKHALSLVIVDIDHFKSFNDTHGHLTGNDVLIELAKRFKAICRTMDFPARYGGEEFVALLPKCALEGATTFAERLRKAVESDSFICDRQALKVTISLGCAQFEITESANQFVARADAALYRAKQSGRNRVEMATQSVIQNNSAG